MEIKRVDIHKKYKPNGYYSNCSKFMLPSVMLPPKLISWESLFQVGFVGCFLVDETKGQDKWIKNAILMIYNPSLSFFEEKWEPLIELLQSRPNFVKYIEYGNLIFGTWLSINPTFGKNLKYFYRKGYFSSFPPQYITHLNDTEARICKKDKNYQHMMEKKLGLEEGDMDDLELASIPEDYMFKYEKNEETME